MKPLPAVLRVNALAHRTIEDGELTIAVCDSPEVTAELVRRWNAHEALVTFVRAMPHDSLGLGSTTHLLERCRKCVALEKAGDK